jgi:predicted RNA-binding Zn-ribbon protein involved in translation (DUF1610 family)
MHDITSAFSQYSPSQNADFGSRDFTTRLVQSMMQGRQSAVGHAMREAPKSPCPNCGNMLIVPNFASDQTSHTSHGPNESIPASMFNGNSFVSAFQNLMNLQMPSNSTSQPHPSLGLLNMLQMQQAQNNLDIDAFIQNTLNQSKQKPTDTKFMDQLISERYALSISDFIQIQIHVDGFKKPFIATNAQFGLSLIKAHQDKKQKSVSESSSSVNTCVSANEQKKIDSCSVPTQFIHAQQDIVLVNPSHGDISTDELQKQVKSKIALLSRGTISFVEKANRFVHH